MAIGRSLATDIKNFNAKGQRHVGNLRIKHDRQSIGVAWANPKCLVVCRRFYNWNHAAFRIHWICLTEGDRGEGTVVMPTRWPVLLDGIQNCMGICHKAETLVDVIECGLPAI